MLLEITFNIDIAIMGIYKIQYCSINAVFKFKGMWTISDRYKYVYVYER